MLVAVVVAVCAITWAESGGDPLPDDAHRSVNAYAALENLSMPPAVLDRWVTLTHRVLFTEEAVVQIHPPRSEYVNFHETCLHLWKPVGREVELPPAWMVGPVINLQPQGARGLTGIRR